MEAGETGAETETETEREKDKELHQVSHGLFPIQNITVIPS